MNELKVGVMALSSIIALVIMSFMVTKNQSGFGNYVTYHTFVKDASGIFPKTPIKVAGITAGRITAIDLVNNEAKISFEVLEKVQVKTGSYLNVKTIGFLGDKYIEVVIGKGEGIIPDGSLMLSDQAGGIEEIAKEAQEVVRDVKQIVEGIKDAVAPDDGTKPLTKIVSNVDGLVLNLKNATDDLKKLLSENRVKLDETFENLNRFSERLSFHTDEANSESAMADIKKLLANAKDVTAHMDQIIVDIQKGKGTMGKLLVEEDIADEVKSTLSGVKKMIGRVDSLRSELQIMTGVNSEDGSVTDAHLSIYPSPERFYLLGITTSEFGPKTETYTTNYINGVRSDEIKEEREKGEYRFDVQLGRRIHNWGFRGGIFESTGGIAIDWFIRNSAFRLSSEFFDYRDELGINWRVLTEFHVWNVVYSKLAFEDIVNSTRSMSFSVGIRFNDEDLKGLLSFFL